MKAFSYAIGGGNAPSRFQDAGAMTYVDGVFLISCSHWGLFPSQYAERLLGWKRQEAEPVAS